jgi:hypothetical protein
MVKVKVTREDLYQIVVAHPMHDLANGSIFLIKTIFIFLNILKQAIHPFTLPIIIPLM